MMPQACAYALNDGLYESLVGSIHSPLRHDVHRQFLSNSAWAAPLSPLNPLP